jgi:DNA-binding transcriptional MocR family regulator
MHFDPRGPSKYVQFADFLRRQIESGELTPGALLPSESALMQRFDVSRPMARKAVAILRNEGLVTTEQGIGTKVRELPLQREPVVLEPGAEAVVRMPSENERVELELDYGVPVIEIHYDGTMHLRSADEVVLRAAEKAPAKAATKPAAKAVAKTPVGKTQPAKTAKSAAKTAKVAARKR